MTPFLISSSIRCNSYIGAQLFQFYKQLFFRLNFSLSFTAEVRLESVQDLVNFECIEVGEDWERGLRHGGCSTRSQEREE